MMKKEIVSKKVKYENREQKRGFQDQQKIRFPDMSSYISMQF